MEIKETFSSKLINYSEPHQINNEVYTKIFTELNTELSVGSFVYIFGGNFDNSSNPQTKGYKILSIDKNSIVIDKPFTNETPWQEDPLSNYTSVYVVDDLDKFRYENTSNNFSLEFNPGGKYLPSNNSIFLSKIEDLPFTQETQTDNKFFKSKENLETSVIFSNTKGQLFNDTNSLNFKLQEVDKYNITSGAGLPGNSDLTLPSGFNFVDNIILDNDNDGLFSITSNIEQNKSNLFSLNKKSLLVNNSLILEKKSGDGLRANTIDNIDTSIISIMGPDIPQNPIDNYNFEEYYFAKLDQQSIQEDSITGIGNVYEISNDFNTLVIGFPESETSNNFRSFGFYSSKQTNLIPIDYFDTPFSFDSSSYETDPEIDPYFVLSNYQSQGVSQENYIDEIQGGDDINFGFNYSTQAGFRFFVKSGLDYKVGQFLELNPLSDNLKGSIILEVFSYDNNTGELQTRFVERDPDGFGQTQDYKIRFYFNGNNTTSTGGVEINSGNYFPVSEGKNQNHINIVPYYAEFSGIGTPVKSISNTYQIQGYCNNLEMCFAGGDIPKNDGESIEDGHFGGLYFYSYSGSWIDTLTTQNPHMYCGNAFDLSKQTFDNFSSGGKWENSNFNPFSKILKSDPIDDYKDISNIKDVIFLGVEKKELGLNLTFENSQVKKGTNQGIFYSKYLVVNTPNTQGSNNISAFFVYINYDSNLLLWNEEFRSEVANLKIPQVHVVLEKFDIDNDFPTTIGSKIKNKQSITDLKGDFLIDSLDIEANNTQNFSNISFDDVSVSNIDTSEDKWILSSSSNSPRFFYPISNIKTEDGGILLYDNTISEDYKELKLNNNTQVQLGDSLPSNKIFKAVSEEIDGIQRIWAATPLGIYLFEYTLDFQYDYYEKVDFDSNEISTSEDNFSNGKIYIQETFEYDGVVFEKGKVYKFSNEDKVWIEDLESTPSILSKAHFRGGDFKDGVFNDGFFGDLRVQLQWNGPQMRHGIFYNSIWSEGEFGSKSSQIIDRTFRAKLDQGEISFTFDENNNNTFGYNYFIESFFKEGVVTNGNFEKSVIGQENNSFNLLNNLYQSNEITFSDISIDNINIEDSHVYQTRLKNSRIKNSKIISSLLENNNVILSNQIKDSKIEDGIINQKGSIEILGHDKWFNLKYEKDGKKVIQSHKFFVSQEDFNKINYSDKIIFDKVETSTENNTNILDNIFYVLAGEEGFYKDFYRDYNNVIDENGFITHNKVNFEVFVSKKTKIENTSKSNIRYNEASNDLEIFETENNEPLYSIDLNIVVDEIPYNSDKKRYLDSLQNDGVLKFSVIDTSEAVIEKNHLSETWLNGGRWVGGSIINPEQLTHRIDFTNDSFITTETFGNTNKDILIELDDQDSEFKSDFILNNRNDLYQLNENNPEESKIVNLNNIWNSEYDNTDSFAENLSGNFKIKFLTSKDIQDFNSNNPSNQIPVKNYWLLQPLKEITTKSGVEVTTPISQYININTNRVDGIDNNLTIENGVFKNQNFKNTTIENPNIELTEKFDYFNYRKLLIINSDISNVDNNTIGKSVLSNGYISKTPTGSLTSVTGIHLNQVIQEGKLINGVSISSAFIDGELEKSIFTNSKFKDINSLLVINNKNTSASKTAILPVWHGGNFINGEFKKSIWLDGNFEKGRFKESEFLNGTFLNGFFGETNVSKDLSVFRKGIWEDGVFENGIFSDNSNFVEQVNSIYTTSEFIPQGREYSKEGTNIWKRGSFNNGIFSSIDTEVSLFESGSFNNGELKGNVIWIDGSFNDGIFNSQYGRFTAPVWGEVDLSDIGNQSSTDSETFSVDINQNLNDLDFLNENNIASIREENGDSINNPGTIILDTSSNTLKFCFVGDSSNPDQQIFNTQNSQHGYSEKKVSDSLGDQTKELYLIFKPLNYLEDGDLSKKHPLFKSEIIGSRMYLQNSKEPYIFDGNEWVEENNFLSQNIKGTNIPYESVYAWRKGIFNDGIFGDPTNRNNSNPSWEDGTFNGGNFYGKVWKDGILLKGNFYGSGIDQLETSSENIFRGFDPQSTIKKYLPQASKIRLSNPNGNQKQYFISITNTSWFGLWKKGRISGNQNKFNFDSKTKDNFRLESFNVDRFGKSIKNKVSLKNVLWEDGIVDNSNSNLNSVVFLKGDFKDGVFKNSIFNPYVERLDFEKGIISDKTFKFELDTTKAVWNGGTFDGGVFYYSDFRSGLFKKGTMVGGRFQSGIAEYMSAFSVIWENGRFRNGNWYGANFTLTNEFNENSVPNPFDYLHKEFQPELGTPFINDILSNNSLRLQDDRVFVWNSLKEEVSGNPQDFEFNNKGHQFGSDTDSDSDIFVLEFLNQIQFFEQNYTGSISSSVDNSGFISLTFSSQIQSVNPNASPTFLPTPPELSFNLVDSKRIPSGGYQLDLFTDKINEEWDLLTTNITGINFRVKADVYDSFGNQINTNKLIKEINSLSENDTQTQFLVPVNNEYNIKIDVTIQLSKSQKTSPFVFPDIEFFTKLQKTNTVISYTPDNNTLNGSIVPVFTGDYLNSEIETKTLSFTYSDLTGSIETSQIERFDSSLDIPTEIQSGPGIFTQFGNGSFQKGIWENGVWNNGYRAGEFGYFITDSPSSLSQPTNNTNINVEKDDIDSGKPKYRTQSNIYFNKINTSFRVRNNRWLFSLESANEIQDTQSGLSSEINKLKIGDQISLSNVSVIDINNNRKPLNGIFEVINFRNNKEILLEYNSEFPVKRFEKSSDRHLILVNKNIWKNGAFLNGLFQGISNNIFVRGNPNTTKFTNSHFIELDIKGGKIKGEKSDLGDVFVNRKQSALSLSPEFRNKYDEKFHETLIERMNFDADESVEIKLLDHPTGLKIFGNDNKRNNPGFWGKEITSEGVSQVNTPVYKYNTDLDLVYEPEEFSSIFDAKIFNNLIKGKNKINNFLIGPSGTITELNNIPAGYITHDVLKSKSTFRYNRSKDLSNVGLFKLNLGSDFREFNTLSDINFSEEPNEDVTLGDPSNDNIIQSSTYGIEKARYKGTTGRAPIKEDNESQFIHNEFMYNFIDETEDQSYLFNANSNFNTKNRYHLIEVDLEFLDEEILDNPFSTASSITISTTYSYTESDQLPKLSIGQYYNEFIEVDSSDPASTTGSLSPFDNDIIPFIDKRREGELNKFGETTSKRFKIRSYIQNNFDGVNNSLRLLEKDFGILSDIQQKDDGFIVNTPVYYSFKHTEIDSIPFFKYQNFESPLKNEDYSDWNFTGEQKQIRSVDNRVKIPFYASSVEIDFQDEDFSLIDNLNLQGGTNIDEKQPSQLLTPGFTTAQPSIGGGTQSSSSLSPPSLTGG